MNKNFLFTGMALCVIMMTALAGCPQDVNTSTYPATLVNAVYSGATPQENNTGWLTITFQAGNDVVCAFSADNSTNKWKYNYTRADGKGSVYSETNGWTPGAFTVSNDGKTLTFTSYMGSSRDFKRLRQSDGTVETNPFNPMEVNSSLLNTVWAGETPRDGDWLTITFKADSKVIWSFAFDNSTNEWTYTYDTGATTGTINTGIPWNPASSGFSINTTAKMLTITNYGGHSDSKTFMQLR